MNTFGRNFRLTTFGESHGPALGGVIDGVTPGVRLDLEAIQREADRRRPGQSPLTTARSERDRVEWLSGLSPDGRTLGTPLAFMVHNEDARSADYDNLRDTFRPNHADRTYMERYGIRDHRGGGRASARETLSRVVAGAVARQMPQLEGVAVSACLVRIGTMEVPEGWTPCSYSRLADEADDVTDPVSRYLLDIMRRHDSVGGVVECRIAGLRPGVGNPVFGKLHSLLGGAMLSINAAMGFEYGEGFDAAAMQGSEMADEMHMTAEGRVAYGSNHCGGINGGISNGEEIRLRVAFKPTPTIGRPLHTVTAEGQDTVLESRGRHDPCVAIRAVPVVEAMALLVLIDQLL